MLPHLGLFFLQQHEIGSSVDETRKKKERKEEENEAHVMFRANFCLSLLVCLCVSFNVCGTVGLLDCWTVGIDESRIEKEFVIEAN